MPQRRGRHAAKAVVIDPGSESLRAEAYELRAKGHTYALITRELGIPYGQAQKFGKEYDARHGKPGAIVRRLGEENTPSGAIRIPVRELRNDSARILRRVETGQRFLITVSGHEVAELIPAESRSHFVPRSALERILREAPLDKDFTHDIEAVAGQRVDEL